MARLPIPPINPNNPIPNNPFYAPEQNYLRGEYSPFIIGSGLILDSVSGVLSASGVGASLAAGAGIALTTVGTTTTIANTGLVSITAISPVNVTAGTTPDISVDAASTTQPGVVQLANTTTSSSVSQALTAAAGYSLQQQIDALVVSNNLTLAGTVDGSTGNVATVTAEGTTAGFNVGAALPASAAGNAEYFVIVTTAGTMTPPGGVATAVNQGDWWVSDGTSWIYYPVGFNPTYATTSTPGVVQLATDAEVQAGTESTHAVTSSALQSKLSDSVNLVSSTCIASSTAVKTANDTALAAQNDATQALINAAAAQSDATQALSDAATAQFTADAAIPCACYTAKGDILGGTGAGTFSVLSPGTDGYMLYALSSAANGLQWAAPPADIPCAVITAVGDIVVGSGASTPTALPVGTDGYILAANSACSTGLEWVANSENDVTSVTGTAPIQIDLSDPQVPDVSVDVATPTSVGVVSAGANIGINPAGEISVASASTTVVGVSQLNDTVTSTSTTQAATANAVKIAYDAALNSVQSVTGNAPIQVDLTDPQNPDISVDAASTVASGVVQLNDTVTSTSTTEAGTANAVKTAYDAALNSVQSVTGTAPIQVDLTDPQNPDVSVDAASTTASGVVQLNDTTTSTSTTQALTAAQGKNLQDQINTLSITSNLTLAGTLDASTGNLVTVTAEGTLAGFAVGSPLPAAAAGNAEYFVIATVAAASYTPPGGTATEVHVGDWFLSDGSVWEFLDVGFQAPYASTTTPGVVQLATDAQTQAGTDATLAVTPASAAATYVPLADYATKGDILSASATAGTPVALPVGTDGQILYACATTSSGLCWAAAPAGPSQATPTVLGTVFGCTLGDTLGAVRIGYNAGPSVSGNYNTLVGAASGRLLTTGTSNVGIGRNSLCGSPSASSNVAVGADTILSASAGSCNVAIGNGAMGTSTGSGNVAIGCNAGGGGSLTSGSNNVLIGFSAAPASATGSCQLAIGFSATDNWLTGDSTKAIKPGAGIIDCANSGGTAGQVLMSNGANAICWGSPASVADATPTVAGIVKGCTSGALNNVSLGAGPLTSITTGVCNVGVGYNSLQTLSSGNLNAGVGTDALKANTSGSANSALGPIALSANTTGSCNVAVGFNALCGNTTCSAVTAVGACALLANNGAANVAVGFSAAQCNSTGACNTAVGTCALLGNQTGIGNTAVGMSALRCSTGSSNTAVGHLTMLLNTGSSNTAVGQCAAICNTSGSSLSAFGFNALQQSTSGFANSAFGVGSLQATTSGQRNAAVGYNSLVKNTTGSFNVGIGDTAFGCNTTGGCNVGLGFYTYALATTACFNVAIGHQAGCGSTAGNNNVVIGANVQLPSLTGNSQLALGYGASSYWLTGCSTGEIRPGAGIMDCAGSCGTAGQVLMSNGANAICWGTVSGGSGIPPSTLTAKGDLITATAASTPTALSVGTDGQVLVACSTATEGLAWATPQTSPYITYVSSQVSYTSGTPLLVAVWGGGTMQGTVTLPTSAGPFTNFWDFYMTGDATNLTSGWVQTAVFPPNPADQGYQGSWSVNFPVYPDPNNGQWELYFNPTTNSANSVSFTFFYRLINGPQPVWSI